MLPEFEPIDRRAREPVSSEVTRRLIEYVTSGEIQPGGRLPSERKLSESFDVGRSHVRQAVKSLAILGLIDVRQGDGTYLKRTDSPLLPLAIEWGMLLGGKRTADLIEARHQLEVLFAGLAAERRTEAHLVEMYRLLAVMERTPWTEEWVDADVALHLQITQASGNQSMFQIMRGIRTLLKVWIGRVAQTPGSASPTWAEHAEVIRAIEKRDPSAARAAMEAHMAAALARLRYTLSEHEANAPLENAALTRTLASISAAPLPLER